MQIKSPVSCSQTSWGCAAMGAALSSTYFAATPAPWCSSLRVPKLLDRQHWRQAGDRHESDSKNCCQFFPKKAAEGNNLIETWKQPAGKDSDCRSYNLSTFYLLFPSPHHLFKSAQDTCRSSLELRSPWLGKHRWPACNRINQNMRYGLVYTVNLSWSTEVGGYSSVCMCVYLEEKILKTHFLK